MTRLRAVLRVSFLLSLGTCLPAVRVWGQLPPGTSDAAASSSTPAQIPDPLRTQAADAIERGDMPAALKLLMQLNEKEPEDAGVLFNLGAAQEALDQTSLAEESYRHALRLNGAYLEPHLALGLLLARTNRPTDARGELLAGTTSSAGSPALKARAYRALAELDRTGNPAEARDALLAALKLSPETDDDTLLSASLAEQSGDLPAAEMAYRRVLQRSPNDPAGSLSLSRLLLREKKTDDARQMLQSALQAHPGEPALSAQLATLYARDGNLAGARSVIEPLHAAHPEEPSLTRMYARLLSQTGDYAAAEPLFANLRGKTPGDAELADEDADALIHLKRFGDAERVLQGAVQAPKAFATPEDLGAAAGHLAFAASQNNDPNTVLQAVALRATVLPQSPAIVFLEAIARDKLHQNKQAQALYRQFLSVADSKFPDEEWEARHRLIALEHMR